MEEWFRPEELKKQEEKYRLNEVIPNNLNDFGSYKLMLKEGDIEKSNITNHNDIIPKEKIKSIDDIDAIKSFGQKDIKSRMWVGFRNNCIVRDL